MADGARPTLTVQERPERGSRAARRLRRRGLVPGVVYGGGSEPVAFAVGTRELRQALISDSQVIDLQVGSTRAVPVIVKDQQNHPVRGEVVHLDLLTVRLDETIHSTVIVELDGAEDAPGVRAGGVLEHVTRELNIEALPTDLPERIHVDVRHLDGAATMHLSEVTPPKGVTFLDDPEETIIATIVLPTEEEEPEAIEEETAVVGAEGGTGDEADQTAARTDSGSEGS
jgi:large subunit ribosomal protein L25